MIKPNSCHTSHGALAAVIALSALFLAMSPAKAKLGKDWVEALHSAPWPAGNCTGAVFLDKMYLTTNWASTDGINWTPVGTPRPAPSVETSCAVNNGVFFDIGWGVSSTSDWVTWTSLSWSPYNQQQTASVFNGKIYLSGGVRYVNDTELECESTVEFVGGGGGGGTMATS